MSADEHLRRAFDTLTDRLRDEIARELRAVSDEVAVAVRLETDTAIAHARTEAAAAADQAADVRIAEIVREAEKRIVEAETAAMDKVREADGRTALAETAVLDQQRDHERRLAEAEAAALARIADAERRAADLEQSVAQARHDADARIAEAEEAARAKVAEIESVAETRVANASAAAEVRSAEALRAAEARWREDAESRTSDAVADATAAVETRLRAEADRDRREAVEAAVAAALASAAREHASSLESAAASGTAQNETMRAAHERQLAAFRAIDAARTLTGVLDAAVDAAGREARSALLLVGRGPLRAWRFAGFDAERSSARNLAVPLTEAGVLINAALHDRARKVGDHTDAPRFAALAPGRACTAVPVLLAGEPVAVLYADEGDAGSPSAAPHWQERVEAIARYGSRALEALTAFKAAGLMTRQGSARAPLHHTSRADAPAGVAGDATTDEEEAAQRYARLLVSEIKLYHEADVAAGQRERDLGTRLSAEISRARVLYEQRVPARLRLRTDYFHTELVRTLASGDATLLSAL